MIVVIARCIKIQYIFAMSCWFVLLYGCSSNNLLEAQINGTSTRGATHIRCMSTYDIYTCGYGHNTPPQHIIRNTDIVVFFSWHFRSISVVRYMDKRINCSFYSMHKHCASPSHFTRYKDNFWNCVCMYFCVD